MTPGDAAFRNASAGLPARARRARSCCRSSCSGSKRLGADLAHAARPAVFGGRAQLREFLQQPRKLHQVLAGFARRIAIEAREAIGDVGGVADLAHLAVADHVDAGRHLALHDFRGGLGDHVRGRRRVGDRRRARAPNNTSVTACERGRLPTCVVRMRSVLVRIGAGSAIRVVRGVIARQPALELRVRLAERVAIDLHARPDDRA